MNRWGMVLLLAVGFVPAGCASSSGEQRQQQPAESQNQASEPDPTAIDPQRQDAIERTFARKTSELQDCWSREYDKTHDRKLEGDLTIQMTVAPDGSTHDAKVIKSTMNNADIEGCVAQTIDGWSFPDGKAPVPYLRTIHLGAQF